MLIRVKVFLLSILLFYLPLALADEVLYCASETGAGLISPQNRWQIDKLEPQRLTVKVINSFENIVIDQIKYNCTRGGVGVRLENKTREILFVSCHAMTLNSQFIFNEDSKRFVYTYIGQNGGGYLNNLGIEAARDYIFAGKCESF